MKFPGLAEIPLLEDALTWLRGINPFTWSTNGLATLLARLPAALLKPQVRLSDVSILSLSFETRIDGAAGDFFGDLLLKI